MHKCHLTGITNAVEHAFASKQPTQRDPVKTSGQHAITPALDTVRVAKPV